MAILLGFIKNTEQMNQFIMGTYGFLLALLISVPEQDQVKELTDYISGGQLVIYYRSSYVTDNTASSITYIDFCPNGRYRYFYEGSYTVKGTQNTSNRNNRTNGAGVAENEGDWSVLKYEDHFYLEIIDYLGKKTYYLINIGNLMTGSWKQGNTSYAFATNQANCE
ncbi:hypothetical protein [Winogradskyella sp.]|uniref:hypothetical protein n=1 Tax=Winogradskyella sp. TaxID=1883156 RepID=UPI003BA9E63C